MFMSAMVQIFSWGERWNVPFNEAKPSWMEHFIFHRMKIFVPLHEWKKHSLFVLYNTKIDPCHLTSGTHLHLACYFNSIGIPFLNSPGSSPVKKFSSSESNKVCQSFKKYVQGKIFAFSGISCLDELANAIHCDLWLPNFAVMTEFGTAYSMIWGLILLLTVQKNLAIMTCTHCLFDSWFSKDFVYHFDVKYSSRTLNHEI